MRLNEFFYINFVLRGVSTHGSCKSIAAIEKGSNLIIKLQLKNNPMFIVLISEKKNKIINKKKVLFLI